MFLAFSLDMIHFLFKYGSIEALNGITAKLTTS